MMRKSKVIALLVVCVMMFAAVEPALAWWGEDTAYGTAVGGATGGLWGAIIGAVAVGAGVVATGGLAAIPLAIGAIGGAAATGAALGGGIGATTGAVIGAVADKETVNAVAAGASELLLDVVAGVAEEGGATGNAPKTKTATINLDNLSLQSPSGQNAK